MNHGPVVEFRDVSQYMECMFNGTVMSLILSLDIRDCSLNLLNISTSTTKFCRNEFRAIKNLPVDERWQLSLAYEKHI